jgi:hypothetical protein
MFSGDSDIMKALVSSHGRPGCGLRVAFRAAIGFLDAAHGQAKGPDRPTVRVLYSKTMCALMFALIDGNWPIELPFGSATDANLRAQGTFGEQKRPIGQDGSNSFTEKSRTPTEITAVGVKEIRCLSPMASELTAAIAFPLAKVDDCGVEFV